MKVWNVIENKKIFLQEAYPVKKIIATFSPRSSLIAVFSDIAMIHLWEISTGQRIKILKCGLSRVKAIALTMNNHQIALLTRQSAETLTLRLWDLDTEEL